MQAADIAGERFGSLVARSTTRNARDQRAWLCACDCGNEVIVQVSGLRSGRYTQCRPCRRVTIKPGDTFGRWSVVRVFVEARTMADVRCACGFEKTLNASKLLAGKTKQCRSCANRNSKHFALPPGTAAKNRLISNYKDRARRKGLAFGLSESELSVLFSSDCSYCGAPPSKATGTKRTNGRFVYTGIDRVDNTAGYVLENVVSACSTCNYRKRDAVSDEFLGWIARVASYRLGMRGGV